VAVSRTLGAPSAPRGQRSGSKDPKASRSCNATATNAEHGKVEAAEPLQRLRFLHSTVAFHAVPTLALASKGLATSSNRITWTDDHFPPRAAGIPRSSGPAAMARRDSRRPPVARIARVRAHPCTAALPAARAFAVNRAPRSPPSFTPRRLAAAMLLLPAPHSARAHRMMHSWRMS
jgi:hypothetical protein